MKGQQQPESEMPSNLRENNDKEVIPELRRQAREKYLKDREKIQLEREQRILEDRD